MKDKTAIVGIGQTEFTRWGQTTRASEFQLALEACIAACADAGIEVKDVDGFVAYSIDRNGPMQVARALGVRQVRFANLYPGGGNSVAGIVHNAAMAVFSGTADAVLCYRSICQGQFGRLGKSTAAGSFAGYAAFTGPAGVTNPAQYYAMQIRRYMEEYGVTSRQLAAVALASYKHAQRNPRATMYGRPITIEDHQASRLVADPYHLYDCCQESDGACAVLVTRAARATNCRHRPVYIVSAAQGGSGFDPVIGGLLYGQWNTAGFVDTARDLYTRAEMGPKDIDVAQFYENFTGQTLMAIEDFGFAPRGEGGKWIEGGRIEWPDGELPINTSGGNLAEAYIHGLELMLEGVRQMRGDSTCQVKDAETCLVVSGPSAPPSSAMILRR